MNKASLIIASKLENVRLVALCTKELASQILNEEALAEVELAVVEAINNTIKHACSGSDKYQITINFKLTEKSITIDLADQGKALDQALFQSMVKKDCIEFDRDDIESYPEGGMGLFIIQNCMDEVTYQHENNTNHWRLIKYTSSPSPSTV